MSGGFALINEFLPRRRRSPVLCSSVFLLRISLEFCELFPASFRSVAYLHIYCDSTFEHLRCWREGLYVRPVGYALRVVSLKLRRFSRGSGQPRTKAWLWILAEVSLSGPNSVNAFVVRSPKVNYPPLSINSKLEFSGID